VDDERRFEERSFIEEFGLVFERAGMPRMAGRILGWLLLSDPPYQSADELAEALLASKGSISTTTRLLIQLGLIERFAILGERHDYFRIRTGALQHQLKQGVEQVTMFRKLAERGLGLLEGKAPLTRQGLEEMRDMYAFFEREFPSLLERWEKEREKPQSQLV
jgi:DNA-binding transcriptional regulator GbsR (MarR family)